MLRYSLWLTLAWLLVPSVLLSQGLNSHLIGDLFVLPNRVYLELKIG